MTKGMTSDAELRARKRCYLDRTSTCRDMQCVGRCEARRPDDRFWRLSPTSNPAKE